VRIAFIVQRYGTEILGGSEYHCRLIAERMAARHQVDVLTTCARDYITWKNEYAEGTDRVRGVNVRRFANAETRDITTFNRYSDWIFAYAHTHDDEMEWLRRQGPWCPALIDHLEKSHQAYDVLVFFTYLYAPTVLGLRVAPDKSVLVPTAHDEPAIRLGIYRDVFASPAAMAYNTAVERRFLQSEFAIRAVAEETVGCGVDLPWDDARPVEDTRDVERRQGRAQEVEHRGSREDRGRRAEAREALEAAPAEAPEGGRFRALPPGTQFRRRHRLYGPLALFGGRIDRGKGCEELFEYFGTFVQEGGEATLALMGTKLMPIPEVPWVRFAGMLPEQERLQALEAASVVVVPSPFESLSLLALEAFAVGTPILANARSEVLVEHCRQGNAGLYYENRDEFVEGMKLLMADARLREALGRNGREYVRANYRWDTIIAKYERMIARIRGRSAS
jgi:glycosyltransferase involved in cell wall biosynthesis